MWAEASPGAGSRRADPIAALRERIEILEEENRQLRQLLVPTLTVPTSWQLPPQAIALLLAIRASAPGYMPWARGLVAVYGFDEPDTGRMILQQRLSTIRLRFRALGLPITLETVWSRGILMPPESVAAFDRLTARGEP